MGRKTEVKFRGRKKSPFLKKDARIPGKSANLPLSSLTYFSFLPILKWKQLLKSVQFFYTPSLSLSFKKGTHHEKNNCCPTNLPAHTERSRRSRHGLFRLAVRRAPRAQNGGSALFGRDRQQPHLFLAGEISGRRGPHMFQHNSADPDDRPLYKGPLYKTEENFPASHPRPARRPEPRAGGLL